MMMINKAKPSTRHTQVQRRRLQDTAGAE